MTTEMKKECVRIGLVTIDKVLIEIEVFCFRFFMNFQEIKVLNFMESSLKETLHQQHRHQPYNSSHSRVFFRYLWHAASKVTTPASVKFYFDSLLFI
jgi:hypothetical protein